MLEFVSYAKLAFVWLKQKNSKSFYKKVDKRTRRIWLNSADVLEYCFGCESQNVGEKALFCSILFVCSKALHKFSFVFLYDPWPFPILPHLPSPFLQVTWALPIILSSEPVTNVHEMNPDSKSHNSTLSSIDPVWQQDRSIQIDRSKTAYWSSWWEIWQTRQKNRWTCAHSITKTLQVSSAKLSSNHPRGGYFLGESARVASWWGHLGKNCHVNEKNLQTT